MPGGMAEVRFEHVFKRYPPSSGGRGGKGAGEEVVAVRDLDLTLPDKGFAVLVGPSGCGKSTTLRMVAGLEEISEGSLFIGDRWVNNLEPRDRDIAMVFQSYALYPHMTCYENMAFGLRVRRMPAAEIDTRVQAAADILGITELLQRRPAAMSGGQRQRVAMGRAIVREPAVFLFDEPLSNLDAKLRAQMRIELARLHQRLGTTIVYVTHDQLEAMTLADMIVVMNGGVVQQAGPPRQVYDQPVNRFVASFIGSPPMGFHAARIDGDNTVGGVTLPRPADVPVSDGQEVLVGVRPESWRTDPDGDVMLGVEVVEPIGAEVLAHGDAGAGPIIVRLPGDHRAAPGDSIPLSVDPAKVHLFDPETEVRLHA
jgi:multiple sugar transport system ATP-binding protein